MIDRIPLGALRSVLLLAVLLLGQSQLFAADAPGMGLIWDHFQLTLEPGSRTEAFGPFYYREELESQRTWAVPPLLSYARDPELELLEFDFAYPVLTYDRYGEQYRWQFFQLLSFAGGATQTETNRHRFTLYPFYFQQRSTDPSENYTALVPFYGHLKNRLMRHEIFFVMFPLYSKTRKFDVVTRNYLYPFFHLREGAGLEGWQLWPITGHEHKEPIWRTNRFGDEELVPGHDKRFVLWPIYFNQTTGLGTTNLGHQFGVIPAFSILRSPGRDSTTVLWPFFSRIDDREKKYKEWDAPWPLVVFAHGEGKKTTRVFPFFSKASNTNLQSDFYLWPIYKFNRVHSASAERRRTRIAFFLYSDIQERNLETGKTRSRLEMWPFFTRKRELNGNTRLQVLAVLEPIIPGTHKIERDYSPLWSLWRAERNPTTGASSQSLLWNLYRRDAAPESTKVSALFGLYQSSSTPEGKHRRILFIPFGKKGGGEQVNTKTPGE